MASHFRLYTRPLALWSMSLPTLDVSGALPSHAPGDAYEGRLPITGYVGDCVADLIAGELPPASTVTVDNATHEVVVKWPAYTVSGPELVNPDFETGDLTGYSYTTIGGSAVLGISQQYTDSGDFAAHWPGGLGSGSEYGIECVVVNDAKGSVAKGQLIRGSTRTMYNPAGHVFGSQARARLLWYDASDNLLTFDEGNLIFGRGNNGDWRTSDVIGEAPADGFVRQGAWLTARTGDVYLDNLAWNLPQIQGTPDPRDWCITLRVRDSLGRAADWSGCILENAVIYTSQPYPMVEVESMTPGSEFVGAYTLRDPVDILSTQSTFISAQLPQLVNYLTYVAPADDHLSTSSQFLAGSIVVEVGYVTVPAETESLSAGSSFVSASLPVVAGYLTQSLDDALVPGSTFISGALT